MNAAAAVVVSCYLGWLAWMAYVLWPLIVYIGSGVLHHAGRLVGVALLLATGTAFAADLVATNGGDTVRITDRPCTNPKVLAHLEPQEAAVMHHATAIIRGNTYSACWGVAGQRVYLRYEDGDAGLIGMLAFKPAPDT